MAQRTKTIEFAFDTRLTLLPTATTLAAGTRHDFTAITLYCPETTSRTMRSVEVIVTARDAETTTVRTLDGCRIGIKLDAVAFNDLDLTGTGIANTGDPMSVIFTRDVTSYFVTNFTGASHTCQVGVVFESATASNVNNITAKLRITYEYDDSVTTHIKTVRIPLEGNTGFASTSANTNIRGSTGAAQIPNLDSFLPEASKTYRNIWFEVYATDGGAATTDFNINYAIDGGTTATRATLEEVLNGSVFFYDIWPQDSLATNSTHDFQAWSSLASRFERLCVVLHVTYEFDASSTSTVINSLMVAADTDPRSLPGTAAADQDLYENTLWIAEPTTITLVQSGLLLFWNNGGVGNVTVSVAGAGAAGGSQGTTTSTYTGTAFVGSGVHMLCHRIDVAHGGSAITLGRGKNLLHLKAYASASNAVVGLTGFYILNYTSGKASAGVGAHNHTTYWCIQPNMSGAIAGSAYQEIATTNQRTPNLPETAYWSNGSSFLITGNHAASGSHSLRIEIKSGEYNSDGWVMADNTFIQGDGEYGTYIGVLRGTGIWKRYPASPYAVMDLETARKYRLEGTLGMWSLTQLVTYHALTWAVAGTVSGYVDADGAGLTVRIFRESDNEFLGTATTTSGGAFTFTWYDNVNNVYAVCLEGASTVGASWMDVAA